MQKSFNFVWLVLALAVAIHDVKAYYIDQQSLVSSTPSPDTLAHNLLHNQAAQQVSILPAYLPYYDASLYTSDVNPNKPEKIAFSASVVPSQLYYSQTPAKIPSTVYCLTSQIYGSQLPSNGIKYSTYQIPTTYNKLIASMVNAATPSTHANSFASY